MSVAAAVVVVVAGLLSADDHQGPLALLGGAAIALLVFGVVTSSVTAVAAAVVGVGAMVVAADVPGSPSVAIGVFVVAEAALACRDDRFRADADPDVWRDRLLVLSAVLAAALITGAVMQLVARADDAHSGSYTIVAAGCVVALAALMAVAARHRPH